MDEIEKHNNQSNYSKGIYTFLSIYKFTVEYELLELLGGEATQRMALCKFFGNLGRHIADTNLNWTLTAEELESCKRIGFSFDGVGRIVGFKTKRSFNEHMSTSISIEYDEHSRMSCISMCYHRESTSMINIQYDELSLSPKSYVVTFSTKNEKGEFIDKDRQLVLPADMDSQIDIFFDQPMSQEQIQAYNEYFINNPTLNSELDFESYYEGVMFDTAEAAIEALVLYGEGNFTRRGEQSGLGIETDKFMDAYDADMISAATDTSTETIENFVNLYFGNLASMTHGDKYSHSFDYPDMEKFGFNNFFKSIVTIERTLDGRFIVGVYSGSGSAQPETRWANAIFQPRAFRGANVSIKFQSKDNVYFVGGLNRIEEALRSMGFEPATSLDELITGEDIEFWEEYNSKYMSLSSDYVYGSSYLKKITLKKEGFPFSVVVNLRLPRKARVGVKFISTETGAKIETFDNWDFTEEGILLRLPSHNFKAFEPYLDFNFVPIIAVDTDIDFDPYSEDAVLMVEQVKNELMQRLMQD